MARNESTIINDGPSCLVERFIIIHLGLLPGGLGGTGFDEASSVDELSEYILYYFDSRQSCQSSTQYSYRHENENEPIHSRVTYNNDSAIRFAGLCHALYSFPSSLSSRKGTGAGDGNAAAADFTKEVQLSTCKLIFIPLERSEVQGLFAVAQCPKHLPSSTNSKKGTSTVNPTALRDYFQNYHDLFQLTKGGGIHGCLSSFDPTVLPSWIVNSAYETVPSEYSYDNNGACAAYPGMEELYSHHKRLRKLNEKYEADPNGEYFNETEMHQTQRIINELFGFLPIHFIRKDLEDFYDWILGQCNVQKKNINLSTFFPAPVVITKNMESSQRCCCIVAEMEALFQDDKNNALLNEAKNLASNVLASKLLIGFSAFHRGNHISTLTRSTMSDIPLHHVRLIYNYLSSHSDLPKTNRSIGSNNHHHKKYRGQYVSPHESRKHQNYYSEEILSPSLGRIWAPRLFLNYNVPSYAVLYKYHEMSFIFYLHCVDFIQSNTNTDMNDTNMHPITETLQHLSEYVDHAADNESGEHASNRNTYSRIFRHCEMLSSHGEPGLKVLYADRTSDVFLFMDGDVQSLAPNTKNKFFILPFLHDDKLHRLNQIDASNFDDAFDLHTPKHLRLSLEEMLNEIHLKRKSNNNIKNTNGYELCSLLPKNKWLFGLSDKEGQREMFVILNADIHFSVADVLQKINEICSGLLETE